MFAIGRLIGGQSSLARARRSRIHGTGLFAKKDIPEGEKIIEYTGEKITKAEGNRRYDEQAEKNQIYLFELNSRYDIDGSAKGNIAKYANHSCDPNAEAIVEKGEIWLVALTDIGKGEEITFDYNFPLFDYEKRPCRCGSEDCRGWIINKDSYYYLKRKNRKGGKKTAKKAGGKRTGANRMEGGGHAVRKTPTRTEDGGASTPRKVKKTGKKTAKKAGKSTRKTGKKATRKTAKKAGKSTRKTGKKATRKTAKKAGKSTRKTGKKATRKTAKKAGKSTRKTAKKAGKSTRKTGKKAAKKAAKKSSGNKRTRKASR